MSLHVEDRHIVVRVGVVVFRSIFPSRCASAYSPRSCSLISVWSSDSHSEGPDVTVVEILFDEEISDDSVDYAGVMLVMTA